jgi:hypothetical protein
MFHLFPNECCDPVFGQVNLGAIHSQSLCDFAPIISLKAHCFTVW